MTSPRKEKECRKVNKTQCRPVTEVVKKTVEDLECSVVKTNECRTVSKTVCEEEYEKDVDTYGAPLAPPLKQNGESPYTVYCMNDSNHTNNITYDWRAMNRRIITE